MNSFSTQYAPAHEDKDKGAAFEKNDDLQKTDCVQQCHGFQKQIKMESEYVRYGRVISMVWFV